MNDFLAKIERNWRLHMQFITDARFNVPLRFNVNTSE